MHRIGQKKEVVVKRFIIQDSVEERILTLQERKKKLAREALKAGGGFERTFSQAPLFAALNFPRFPQLVVCRRGRAARAAQ